MRQPGPNFDGPENDVVYIFSFNKFHSATAHIGWQNFKWKYKKADFYKRIGNLSRTRENLSKAIGIFKARDSDGWIDTNECVIILDIRCHSYIDLFVNFVYIMS